MHHKRESPAQLVREKRRHKDSAESLHKLQKSSPTNPPVSQAELEELVAKHVQYALLLTCLGRS